MIECSNEFLYYKRKNRKFKFKRFFHVFITFFIIFVIVFYYKKVTVPLVQESCFEKINAVNVKCVNNSIISALTGGVDYEDLIVIEKNSQGEITLISTNSQKINLLSRKILSSCENNLNEEIKKGIDIPLLTFSGLTFLVGYGSNVNFKTISVENVSCNFISDFTSCSNDASTSISFSTTSMDDIIVVWSRPKIFAML